MRKKSGLLISLFLIHAQAACIDLNHVKVEVLRHVLPHMGYKKAKAIIDYRKQFHGFSSIYELEAVKGIGFRYLEKHRCLIEKIFCKIS